MKLGRNAPPPAKLPKMLRLEKYLTQRLPPAPQAYDATEGVVYPLYQNDRYGNCTCAALAHYFATVSAREGRCVGFTDQDILDYYFHLSKGEDNGLYETDVLHHVMCGGFPKAGTHRLAAWVRISPHDHETMRRLLPLFHCLYLGVELPMNAQEQTIWKVLSHNLRGDAAPGSWGGHALVMPKYTKEGPEFVTWGRIQKATWTWLEAYLDEAYCLLDVARGAQWGVDMPRLLLDLQSAGVAA